LAPITIATSRSQSTSRTPRSPSLALPYTHTARCFSFSRYRGRFVTCSSGRCAVAPAAVFATLDEIVRTLPPFESRFLGVGRFPSSDIFYLVPDHPENFLAAQRAIAASGLRFDESPFPFVPHCTIRSIGQVSAEDEQALLALKPPPQAFALDTLAVYELVDGRKSNLLHRTRLAGNG